MTLHLAVGLNGTGWHPASWTEPGSDPERLTDPQEWVDQVRTLEAAGVAFVTFEDAFGNAADTTAGPSAHRTDALLLAARIGPVTTRIGLVPTVLTNATEPFHIAKAVATLDHVTLGRAGVRPRWSAHDGEIEIAGRGKLPALTTAQKLQEAADHVEVQRRLWDSWEDNAEIRDAATGRFVDIDRLHTIDFAGEFFDVRGPSITPRPPQGQPPVVISVADRAELGYAAAAADVVLFSLADDPAALSAELEATVAATGRTDVVLGFVDLLIALDTDTESGADRLARLDKTSTASDVARTFTGSVAALADLLTDLANQGAAGVRLLPAVAAIDLPLLATLKTQVLSPVATDLRTTLGLSRPVNRYATPSLEGASS